MDTKKLLKAKIRHYEHKMEEYQEKTGEEKPPEGAYLRARYKKFSCEEKLEDQQ